MIDLPAHLVAAWLAAETDTQGSTIEDAIRDLNAARAAETGRPSGYTSAAIRKIARGDQALPGWMIQHMLEEHTLQLVLARMAEAAGTPGILHLHDLPDAAWAGACRALRPPARR